MVPKQCFNSVVKLALAQRLVRTKAPPRSGQETMGHVMGTVGTHGHPWVPMDTHGYPWVPMGTHGYPCVPMGAQGYPWVPMGTHGCPCHASRARSQELIKSPREPINTSIRIPNEDEKPTDSHPTARTSQLSWRVPMTTGIKADLKPS